MADGWVSEDRDNSLDAVKAGISEMALDGLRKLTSS